jgi:pimeloyl-ACP methyl ester carboxylesterase
MHFVNGTYDSGNAQLAYRDSAAGVPVVFLHPTPLDDYYWLPLAERLEGIRAILPDLRGHGSSELGADLPVGDFARVPDAPVLTMAQFASDLLALLDHLQISQAIFAGCSIGGYVLLELWRRAPQRMRALAFICSKPQPDAEANLAKRADTIARARAGEIEELLDAMAQVSVGATAQAQQPAIVSELRSRMTLSAEALVAVQAGLAARPDSLPTVPTIRVPVFALAGGEDKAVSPAEMQALSAASGANELHLLADAGHFAAYEQPDAVAALLNPWLRQFAS